VPGLCVATIGFVTMMKRSKPRYTGLELENRLRIWSVADAPSRFSLHIPNEELSVESVNANDSLTGLLTRDIVISGDYHRSGLLD